jgi:DNA-binding LacI/PurR family transcriptional regulator
LSRPDRVSEELRAKVQAAAVALGYRVRQPARSPEADASAVTIVCKGGVWARLADSLGDSLERQGLETARLTATRPEQTWTHLDGMARIALIGLRPPEPLLARAATGELRLATIVDGPASCFPVSVIEYAAHAALSSALAALRGLGHRGIVRWQARAAPLFDAGRQLDPDVTDMRWLESGSVTALICDDAPTAAWAVLAARQSGIQVPEELSIVALADHPILRVVSPSVTAFSEPIGEIVGALVNALLSEEPSTGAIHTPKVRVAVRASMAPPTMRST